MLDEAVVIYCICDEVWKVFGLQDDHQCKMSTPEVMTFCIISAYHYGCSYHKHCTIFLVSQLVRRIHQVPQAV
jgi:hypothetical protein